MDGEETQGPSVPSEIQQRVAEAGRLLTQPMRDLIRKNNDLQRALEVLQASHLALQTTHSATIGALTKITTERDALLTSLNARLPHLQPPAPHFPSQPPPSPAQKQSQTQHLHAQHAHLQAAHTTLQEKHQALEQRRHKELGEWNAIAKKWEVKIRCLKEELQGLKGGDGVAAEKSQRKSKSKRKALVAPDGASSHDGHPGPSSSSHKLSTSSHTQKKPRIAVYSDPRPVGMRDQDPETLYVMNHPDSPNPLSPRSQHSSPLRPSSAHNTPTKSSQRNLLIRSSPRGKGPQRSRRTTGRRLFDGMGGAIAEKGEVDVFGYPEESGVGKTDDQVGMDGVEVELMIPETIFPNHQAEAQHLANHARPALDEDVEMNQEPKEIPDEATPDDAMTEEDTAPQSPSQRILAAIAPASQTEPEMEEECVRVPVAQVLVPETVPAKVQARTEELSNHREATSVPVENDAASKIAKRSPRKSPRGAERNGYEGDVSESEGGGLMKRRSGDVSTEGAKSKPVEHAGTASSPPREPQFRVMTFKQPPPVVTRSGGYRTPISGIKRDLGERGQIHSGPSKSRISDLQKEFNGTLNGSIRSEPRPGRWMGKGDLARGGGDPGKGKPSGRSRNFGRRDSFEEEGNEIVMRRVASAKKVEGRIVTPSRTDGGSTTETGDDNAVLRVAKNKERPLDPLLAGLSPNTKRRKLRELNAMTEEEKRQFYLDRKGNGRYKTSSITTPAIPLPQINPARNGGMNYHYEQTVRGKEARKGMHAVDCACCTGYYDATKDLPRPGRGLAFKGTSDDEDAEAHVQRHKNDISRHRQLMPGDTDDPPGFWQMPFPTSQQVKEQNALGDIHKQQRIQRMHDEARKDNGRYRYA